MTTEASQDTAGQLAHFEVLYSARHYGVERLLSESLAPRDLGLLMATARGYLAAGDRVLDIGCRDAGYLTQFARDPGTTGVGIDPLVWHLGQATAKVRETATAEAVGLARARMEQLPFADARFDAVWCRDVIPLIADLRGGLAEAHRVLRPGGHMLVYTVFATERLEPREAEMLCAGLGNVRAHMKRPYVEALFSQAGFEAVHTDVVGTEWREYEEEREKPVSSDLLMLARLRRNRAAVVAEVGEEIASIAEASLHWLAYILLGKLLPVIYVLRKPDTTEASR